MRLVRKNPRVWGSDYSARSSTNLSLPLFPYSPGPARPAIAAIEAYTTFYTVKPPFLQRIRKKTYRRRSCPI